MIPVLLIFLGATISTLFSVNLQVSAGLWKAYFLDPLLFLIVFIDTIRAKKQIKDIITAFSLSGLVVAMISLWYWFSGELTYDGRLRAFYLSPNHLAMYLAPCLIMSFILQQFIRKNWQKFLLFTVYCLLFIVLYLTQSYGAWLGVIGALIFILISKLKKCHSEAKPKNPVENSQRRYPTGSFTSFRMTTGILTCLIILLVVFLYLSQLQTQKFQDFLSSSRSSYQSRLIIWQVAGSIIKDHPCIGIGPGMFQKYYLDYQPKFEPYLEWAVPQPHNIFLAFWLQTGLLGLIGFLWLLVVFFKKILEQLQKAPFGAAPKWLAAVMIYILIHGLVDTPYWKNDLAIIFWLIIALSLVGVYLTETPR